MFDIFTESNAIENIYFIDFIFILNLAIVIVSSFWFRVEIAAVKDGGRGSVEFTRVIELKLVRFGRHNEASSNYYQCTFLVALSGFDHANFQFPRC